MRKPCSSTGWESSATAPSNNNATEHQDLNLLTAAIVLWNTVYLERATGTLNAHQPIDADLLQHLSPLGWEHINLTGDYDYTWKTRRTSTTGKYKALRPFQVS